jgi:hypothetical protein
MWPILVMKLPVKLAENMVYKHFSTRVTEKHGTGTE